MVKKRLLKPRFGFQGENSKGPKQRKGKPEKWYKRAKFGGDGSFKEPWVWKWWALQNQGRPPPLGKKSLHLSNVKKLPAPRKEGEKKGDNLKAKTAFLEKTEKGGLNPC